MSNYKNVKGGLKKIFTATILEIIALAMALTAVLINKTVGNQIVNAIGIIIFGLAASVLMIISIIINTVGLYAAGKDESNFKNAYYNSITALVVTVINLIISSIPNIPGVVYEYINIFVDVASLSAIIYACNGLAALLRESGKTKLAKYSPSIIVFVAIAFIVSIMFSGATAETFAPDQIGNIILLAIGGVCEIIGYIIYLVYLKKTSEVL